MTHSHLFSQLNPAMKALASLAHNPIFIFVTGMGLTVGPILGIMFIHRKKNPMDLTKKEFTVEEFEANFDELFERVENGETFTIMNGPSRCLIMPIDQLPGDFYAK